MRLPVVYIAGPFRGQTQWEQETNVRIAERVALGVWKLGAVALCPHTLTRFYQKELDDAMFLRGGIELLRRCDAVLLCPEWSRSVGTRAEITVAMAEDIPVCLTLGELARALREKGFHDTQGLYGDQHGPDHAGKAD